MQIHWLWYALLQGLNDREKAELLTRFPDAEELYFADRDRLSALEDLTPEGMAVLLDKDLAPAEKILRECIDKEISLLTYGDEAYPLALRSIADPPMVLYYRGTLPDFDAVPLIGVVGTRSASGYGLTAAKRMGFQLARCGGIVVSGGAKGIDSMAMEGALMGGGTAVGVLGCGVDVVYPLSSRALFEDVLRGGCLMSEFPPGTPPMRWNFPRRNRIISGLSCGVVVVEAPRKSGALITAALARDQGRDVFVVTGNVDVESCAGSNDLLRKGAIFAACGYDVLQEYEARFPGRIHPDNIPAELALKQDRLERREVRVAQKTEISAKKSDNKRRKEKRPIDNGAKPPYIDCKEKLPSLSENERRVLEQIKGPRLVDDVIADAGIPAGLALAALTLLEVKGLVTRLPGKRVGPRE